MKSLDIRGKDRIGIIEIFIIHGAMRKTIWKDNSWPRWRPVRDASFVDQRRAASKAEISGENSIFQVQFFNYSWKTRPNKGVGRWCGVTGAAKNVNCIASGGCDKITSQENFPLPD